MPDALMVTSSFLPGRGGIESYLEELCAELAPRLAVMAPARREGRTIPGSLPYDVTGHAGRMLVPSAGMARAIEKEARRAGTDRVLFGTPWPLALTGPRLSRRGIRYAVIVHGAEMLVPAAVPIVRARLAASLSGADLLLPVSEFTAERIRDLLENTGYEMPPVAVLRARVDLERFRPEAASSTIRDALGVSEGERVLLCFGRLVRRKGVDRVIRALPAIRKKVPGTRLVVAGTGPELRRLRRLARGLGEDVVFAGRVPAGDAPAVYASADAFVLPVVDRWFGLEVEGLGVVLLEAGASGTPSVTGRSGGTPEAVIDGDTGIVIDARNRSELVHAVVRLLTDEDLRARMGAAGRSHVADTFANRPIPEVLEAWLR